MADCIKEGGRIESEVLFKRLTDDVPTNPDVVTVIVQPPSGPTISFTHPHVQITNPSPGLFRLGYVPDAPGTWWFSWRGESTTQDAPNAIAEHGVVVERRVVDE